MVSTLSLGRSLAFSNQNGSDTKPSEDPRGLCEICSGALRQQFAIDNVRDFHLAIWLQNGNILIHRATAVGVVHRVARNRFPICRSEVIDFSDELSVVVECLHVASPFLGEWVWRDGMSFMPHILLNASSF